MRGHHGTHHESLPLHAGLCLSVGGMDDGFDAAAHYARRCGGEWVHEVEVLTEGLTIREVEVTREQMAAAEYPGDSAREIAALVAEGVDALMFCDEVLGRAHRTLRLLSARALASVDYIGNYDP